jgi:glycosyltransferase involved in cell wall biosynthesis
LENYQCGWWIDLSVDSLKRCLEQVMQSSPDEIKRIGDNGRRLVKDKYDIKAVAKNMGQLYEKILN